MAKQIKGNEIIEDGHLENAIKQGEQLKKVYSDLDAQVKKTAKTLKSGLQGTDTNSSAGIAKINAEYKKSNTLKTNSIALDKQKTQLLIQEERLKQTKLRTEKQLVQQQKRLDVEEKKRLTTLRATNSAYKKQSLELGDLRRRYKDLAVAGRENGKVAKGMLIDINRLNASLVKADASVGQYGRNVGNYPKIFGKATASMRQFAGALGLTSGIFLLVNGIRDAIGIFKTFEQSNANLASILGKTSDEISLLTANAKALGETTVFTASQITELQTELAKLGFNENEILASTEAIQGLAAATGTDLAQSATQVGSVIRTFGLDASEATRVVDVLASSTTKSALDMSKLAVALPIVGSTAKTAGLSLERTTSLLGVLSDRGIDASTSATSLRKIFLELAKSGKTWDEAMNEINNSTNKNATAVELFGVRSATAGIILAENAKSADELTMALLKSGGSAEKMANTQLDTLEGSLKLLRSAWEGVVLETLNSEGAFGGLKDVIKFLAENLKTIVKVVVTATKAFIAYKTATFLVTKGLKLAKLGADLFRGGFQKLNATMKANVIGLVVAGLVILYELLKDYNSELSTNEKIQKNLNDVNAEAQKSVISQQTEIKTLTGIIDDENQSLENKEKAIKKLNEISPEYLGNLTLENIATEEGQKMLANYNKELIRTAKVKAIMDKINKLEAQKLDITTGKLKDQVGVWDVASSVIGNFGDSAGTSSALAGKGVDNAKDKVIGLNSEIEALLMLLQEDVSIDDIVGTTETATPSTGSKSNRVKQEEIDWNQIIEINKIGAKEVLSVRTELNKDLAKEEKTLNDILIEDSIEYYKKKRELEEKQRQEQIKQVKEISETIGDLVESALANALSKIDGEIQKSQDLIIASQDRITNLQEQANLGNLDASESIKAERQRIANESAKIEDLEKKKRNLLITITALQVAQQNIQNGDGQALSNASSKMQEFIAGLSGFYDGTETNLGESLKGRGMKIQGDKDTHIIKAHEDEVILGVNNSRKLKGMNQTEITKGALLYKNGELVGNKAVRVSQNREMSLDFSLLNELKGVKDAIKGIDIPQHQFNWQDAIHTIKSGTKLERNHYKKGGIFS
jgi:hypothetical protein